MRANQQVFAFGQQFKSIQFASFSNACIASQMQLYRIIEKNNLSEKVIYHAIKEQHFQFTNNKIKQLGADHEYLLQKGLINMYIEVFDQNKKFQDCQNIVPIYDQILKCFEGIVKYYFMQNQLNQFRKYKKLIKSSMQEDLQKHSACIQLKIIQRVSSKQCSELFKQYLIHETTNKIKQICRICYKQFQINQMEQHVDFCSKRIFVKQQQIQNFQKRLQIISQLQNYIQNQNQKLQNDEQIRQLILFYKKLKKDRRNNRRMSLRYTNCNLTLMSQCRAQGNQKIDVLLQQLSLLQDKSYYLTKKMQQFQFLNILQKKQQSYRQYVQEPYKKCQSMAKQFNNCDLQGIGSQKLQKKYQLKKQSQNNKICQLQSEFQIDHEDIPLIMPKKLRKKMTQNQRYSVSQKSQSNTSQNNYTQMKINHFQILKPLGKGSFGRVYLVRRKKTKDIYALKVIPFEKNWGTTQIQSLKNEYGVYKQIQGQHLVTATFSFQQKSAQFFVLQYMAGGDLSKLLQQQVYFEEQIAKFYLAQILLAIQHLHKSGIIHRDLKPENIVLDNKGHLKLTDFGLSQFRAKSKIVKVMSAINAEQKEKYVKECETQNLNKLQKNNKQFKIIGTPDYIAPQVIQGTSLANMTIDWWSFGVIAYQMIIGVRPFCANSIQQILSNIQKGSIQWPQIGNKQDNISPIAYSFLKSLLANNFEQRLGFNGVSQIKQHEFFRGISWQNIKISNPPLKSVSNFTFSSQEQYLTQNIQLRKQIQEIISSSQQNPLQDLQNYVRFDILTHQTLQSAKQGKIQKDERIKKLRSITLQFENKSNKDIQFANTLKSHYACDV